MFTPVSRISTSAAPPRWSGSQEMRSKLGAADRIVIRDQIASMEGAFGNLAISLIFAAVFVYALMVVNYQSFIDPLAVIVAPRCGQRHPADAVRHRHGAQRALANGFHHVDRCSLGEFDSARHFCTRAARSRFQCV